MNRYLPFVCAVSLSVMATLPAMACGLDEQTAAVDRLSELASDLDQEATRQVIAELCSASIETQTFVPVAAAQAPGAAPAEVPQPEDSSDEESEETTRILGMEFRKADDDSEGLKRLRRKR